MGVTLWSSVISLDTLVCNIWNLLICVLAAWPHTEDASGLTN
jgi:hypothetical protein